MGFRKLLSILLLRYENRFEMEERPDRKAMILSFFKTWRQIVQQILCTYQPSYCSFLLFSYRLFISFYPKIKARLWKQGVYSEHDARKCRSKVYAVQHLVWVVTSPDAGFDGVLVIYFDSVILNWNDILDFVHFQCRN